MTGRRITYISDRVSKPDSPAEQHSQAVTGRALARAQAGRGADRDDGTPSTVTQWPGSKSRLGILRAGTRLAGGPVTVEQAPRPRAEPARRAGAAAAGPG